jgi:hypothetical protein
MTTPSATGLSAEAMYAHLEAQGHRPSMCGAADDDTDDCWSERDHEGRTPTASDDEDADDALASALEGSSLAARPPADGDRGTLPPPAPDAVRPLRSPRPHVARTLGDDRVAARVLSWLPVLPPHDRACATMVCARWRALRGHGVAVDVAQWLAFDATRMMRAARVYEERDELMVFVQVRDLVLLPRRIRKRRLSTPIVICHSLSGHCRTRGG